MAQQKQIPIEEALNLVEFEFIEEAWRVKHVKGDVIGNVGGNVQGSVWGNVECDVYGTISGRDWQLIETPKEKLGRLIKETGDESLLEAFN